MTDIYTNTSAFGLLSEEMQAQMKAHPGLVEFYDCWGWRTVMQPTWANTGIYRAIRPPELLKVYEAWMVVDDHGYAALSHFKASAELMARECGGAVIHLTGSKKDE